MIQFSANIYFLSPSPYVIIKNNPVQGKDAGQDTAALRGNDGTSAPASINRTNKQTRSIQDSAASLAPRVWGSFLHAYPTTEAAGIARERIKSQDPEMAGSQVRLFENGKKERNKPLRNQLRN